MTNVTHELSQEIAAARAIMSNMSDLLGDDAALAADTIEGETNLHEAMQAAVHRVLELDGLMDGISGMIASLKERGDRLQKQRDRLRELISIGMETADIKRLELPAATITRKRTPPGLMIIDEADIPAAFWKPQEPKLNRQALINALRSGETVPGARIDNGSETIQIKVA